MNAPIRESFEDFRRSFSYGSRNDLSFKFLKHLPDEAAAEFFREALHLLGDAYDTGDVTPLIRLAYEAQVQGYAHEGGAKWAYDAAPFAALRKPLSDSRVLLMTSGGHFVDGDDPEPFGVVNMTQEEAISRIGDFLREAPTLSVIPRDTAPADLRVRHGGYDIRSAQRDPNVTFPRDRLIEAEASGRIGAVAADLLSFPGATAQGRLLQILPQWVERIRQTEVDLALLVPV